MTGYILVLAVLSVSRLTEATNVSVIRSASRKIRVSQLHKAMMLDLKGSVDKFWPPSKSKRDFNSFIYKIWRQALLWSPENFGHQLRMLRDC